MDGSTPPVQTLPYSSAMSEPAHIQAHVHQKWLIFFGPQVSNPVHKKISQVPWNMRCASTYSATQQYFGCISNLSRCCAASPVLQTVVTSRCCRCKMQRGRPGQYCQHIRQIAATCQTGMAPLSGWAEEPQSRAVHLFFWQMGSIVLASRETPILLSSKVF